MIKWLVITLLLFIPQLVKAQGLLDELGCIEDGRCTLKDVFTLIILLIRGSLAVIGVVALVWLVWGGIRWISSGGSADKVKKGKDIIVNSILALFVAFSSYLLLNWFVDDILGAKTQFQVNAECSDPNAKVCNTDEHNYVCYKGACITKCEELNQKLKAGEGIGTPPIPSNYSLVCRTMQSFDPAGPNNFSYLINYCPGDVNNICVLLDEHGDLALGGQL